MRHLKQHCINAACIAVAMLAGQAVHAAPITPEIDFRSSDFSQYDRQSSFHFAETVNNIDYDFTVSAQGGNSSLWWDAQDGLGIRGGEHDEISAGQTLRIDFNNPAPLSRLFFSDLFANETTGGSTYDERGSVRLNGQDVRSFTAGLDEHLWGDAGNGEAILELLDIPVVDTLELYVDGGQWLHEFSLLGLTDPVIQQTDDGAPGEDDPPAGTVPLPPTGLLLLAGLLGLAATRRP